ncbi:PIN domain-containing protein [Thermococcus sp.]
MAIRILIDTNVIISALFFNRKPLELLELCIQSKLGLSNIKIEYIIPQYVRDEVHKVISKKFQMLYTSDKRVLLDGIFESAENITYDELREYLPEASEIVGSIDKKDVPIVAAALASNPHYLITGNQRHFSRLENDREIKILSPSKFLENIRRTFQKFDTDIYI